MGERLLAILPRELEMVLWAIPVWQGYLQNLMGQDWAQWAQGDRKEQRDWSKRLERVTVVCEEKYEQLVRWHVPEANCVRGITDGETLEQADLIYEFDVEQARRVTGSVGKSVSESFGIILGAYADRELPVIARQWVKEDIEILYLPRHQSDEGRWEWPYVEDFIGRLKASEVRVRALPEDIDWRDAIRELSGAVGMVGVAGGLTLLAAAMEKPVVELYPDAWTQAWQAKLEDQDYRMIYGDPAKIRADFVHKTLDDLMTTVGRRRRQAWGDTSDRKPILEAPVRDESSGQTA